MYLVLSDNSQNLELAREMAVYFRIKPNTAERIIQDTIKVISGWRDEATRLGISAGEQDRMARAFRVIDS